MQPSELAKPALVIFLAFFVTWRARAINNPRYTLIPAALAVGLMILAVVVADLGTAVVLGAAAPVPYRAKDAESALRGKRIGDDVARNAAGAAIAGTRPLSECCKRR